MIRSIAFFVDEATGKGIHFSRWNYYERSPKFIYSISCSSLMATV